MLILRVVGIAAVLGWASVTFAGNLRAAPGTVVPGTGANQTLRQGTGPQATEIDPASLKLSVSLNFAPPVDNTPVSTPTTVAKGTVVTLRCGWNAEFVKPALLAQPLNLTVVIAETTNGIVQLKQAGGAVKAGNYSFPGPGGGGEVDVLWKPKGLGIHEVSCMVAATDAAWWGKGALPAVKAFRKVQVEPDSFKFCPALYPVQIVKGPNSDQVGVTGTVVPVELVLFFDYSQAAGNTFLCHYKSKNKDVPDVTVKVPCVGAKLLPPQPGQFLKQDRYFCQD